MPALLIVTAVILSEAAPAQSVPSTPMSNPRCGSRCLYMSLRALDVPVADFAELEEKLGPPSVNGYSMGQLAEAARSYGMDVLPVQTNFDNLQRRPERFACIAHIRGFHFVNFGDVTGDRQVMMYDPPRPPTLVPIDTVNTQWDGTALLVSNRPLLAEEDLPQPFPWRVILGALLGLIVAATLAVLVKRRSVARPASS
jgi:ABC-type bacteriocin/lantibiotic exporter with double-glycine peptidase domain